MLKRLRFPILLFILSALAGAMLVGCSSEGDKLIDREKKDYYTKTGGYSFVYVLTETDFDSLKKDVTSGKDIISSIEKYTPVTELNIDEKYYAVGYTVAKNKNGTAITFDNKSGFYIYDDKNGEMYGADIFSYGGYISANNIAPKVQDTTSESQKNGYIFHPIALTDGYEVLNLEICPYVSFTPHSDMRLRIVYGVNAKIAKTTYGEGYFHSVTVDSCYDKKVSLTNMKVSYLEGEDYKDGTYKESALKSSIDMKVSGTYYMVISGTLSPNFDQNTGEVATLTATLPAEKYVTSMLDFATSGSFKEEAYNNQNYITVDFKLPENAGAEKDFELIIRLIPESSSYVRVGITFDTVKGISVTGKDRVTEALFNIK